MKKHLGDGGKAGLYSGMGRNKLPRMGATSAKSACKNILYSR